MNETNTLLMEKHALLQKTRNQLKAEFIGIDHIIGRIIDVVTPWFLFPGIQEKPLIINLWGLTGVGKTSLVNRFVELIDFKDWFFKFDLGESYDREHNVKKILQNIFPHHNGSPMILAFDEFQLARTINSSDQEIEKGFNRNVWEILDHGKLMTTMNCYAQNNVFQLIHLLNYVLTAGTVIEKGVVVKGEDIFLDIMKRHRPMFHATTDFERPAVSEPIRVIPAWGMEEIYELNLGRFNTQYDMEQHLNCLNGPDLVAILQEIYQQSLGQQVMDCSKSLIFVLGNLDEAFPMSNDLNLDISPDEFHQQSLEININSIRTALTRRFRPEQISRLGSCHLIYPAFNSESFKKLISRELKKISERAQKEGLKLEFEPSINDLLFSEGVFPTQGVRPLFTTIQELIGSKIGNLLVERMNYGLDYNHVILKWENSCLIKIFQNSSGEVFQSDQILELSVSKLRISRKDELQAVTAVHEAGHTLISIGLMNKVPESVHSVTSSNEIAGFTKTSDKSRCLSFRQLKAKLTVLMGGLAAEELIFGKENITTGSDSDLRRATRLANELLLEYGMGEIPAFFEWPMNHPNGSLPPSERHRNIATTWLQEAYQEAKIFLEQQKVWLLHLAGYLSEHPMINSKMLLQMASEYGVGIDLKGITVSEESDFYRTSLKNALEKSQNEQKEIITTLHSEFKAA